MANLIGSGPAQLSTNQMLGTMAFQDSQNYLQKVDGVMGYPKGMGGAVTQLTSKSTAVTLNAPCGQITTAADALAAGAVVTFDMTNSYLAAKDVVVVSIEFGGSDGAYLIQKSYGTTGACGISIRNVSAASLSQAIAISFAIIKVQTA